MTTCDTSLKILNTHQTTGIADEILTLKSSDSFSMGAYTESDKALCGKSLATTDYYKTSTVNHMMMQSIVEVL